MVKEAKRKMITTAESAVTRLRKETAKERIEVVAVPVRSHVGKTFLQGFWTFLNAKPR